jgi:hypothetical protein
MVKPGKPFPTWTSTETARPMAPWRVADAMEASMLENGRHLGNRLLSLASSANDG